MSKATILMARLSNSRSRHAALDGTASNRRPLAYVVMVATLVIGFLAGTSGAMASGAAVPTSVDDSVTSGQNSFAYTGNWVVCGGTVAGAYQNSFQYSYTAGNKAVLNFTGTQVKLYGVKEPVGGIATIAIDAKPAVDVDYYAATQNIANVYTSDVLANTTHTLTVTVSGRKGAGASPTINIDRADVVGSGAPATSTPTPPPTSTPVPATGSWLSGGSGDEVTDGTFGAWRGATTPVATTWSDNSAAAQVNLWQFDAGNAFANWTGSVDLSIGAFFDGESWGAAAAGAYDARWSQALSNAKSIWTSKQRGTLYIRFAHEMNGDWYPWAVHPADIGNFKAAWARFYNLKQSIFPGAKLVFGTNGNTAGSNMGYDWRTIWPGDQYVDVYSVDWYSNQWVGNPTYDSYGGPMGLLQHQQFAQQHGKPIAISEWGNNSEVGDQPNYIQFMHDFFVSHGGTGAGQVLYECLFNVHQNNNQFGLFPESDTKAPNAAAKYKALF